MRAKRHAVSVESMKNNALAMYKTLSHIHGWLMAVLYEIRQGGNN